MRFALPHTTPSPTVAAAVSMPTDLPRDEHLFFFFQAEDGIRDYKVSSDVCSSDLTGVLQATGAPSKGRPAAKAPSHSRVRERGKRRSRSGGVLHLFSRASRRRHRPRPSTWSLPDRKSVV